MSELGAFASAVLEQNGALLERAGGAIEAVLPPELCARLRLPEHVRLCEEAGEGVRLGYGSEALERMVALATSTLVVASARLHCGVRAAAAEQAASAFTVRNGVCSAAPPTATSNRRLWVHAAYALTADERREGVTSAVVSVDTGTEVEGFDDAARGALEQGGAGTVGRDAAAAAVLAAVRLCSARAEAESASFRAAMQRRLERDRARLDAYFADLSGELERRQRNGRLDPKAVAEKRDILHRERAAKLEALASRYEVRLEVRPVSAAVVECPGYRLPVSIRRRKAERVVELEFDGPTRRLVPLACDGCQAAALRPAACDEAVHLLCERCAPRAEGRWPCPACEGRRQRTA
ncbi:MAG: hypothetical protein HYZ28_28850 [Myxococcales bacterium]|nr:hypothetical protein [Myxococcales bacterium]